MPIQHHGEGWIAATALQFPEKNQRGGSTEAAYSTCLPYVMCDKLAISIQSSPLEIHDPKTLSIGPRAFSHISDGQRDSSQVDKELLDRFRPKDLTFSRSIRR